MPLPPQNLFNEVDPHQKREESHPPYLLDPQPDSERAEKPITLRQDFLERGNEYGFEVSTTEVLSDEESVSGIDIELPNARDVQRLNETFCLCEENEEPGEIDSDDELHTWGNSGYHWDLSLSVSLKRKDGRKIGYCQGDIINRNLSRQDFIPQMSACKHEFKEFAIVLCDRWGNLKPEFIEHPFKRGSGAWGNEFNQGILLLINCVYVNKPFCRRHRGTELVENMWVRAKKLCSEVKYAVVKDTYLLWGSLKESDNSESDQERDGRLEELQIEVEQLFMAIGYRRIGSSPYVAFATDADHASKRSPISAEYSYPRAMRGPHREANETYSDTNRIKNASDEEILVALKRIFKQNALPGGLCSRKSNGNTIMHSLALGKPQSLDELKSIAAARELLQVKNLEEEIPLDYLQATLEQERLYEEMDDKLIFRADDFQGFPPAKLSCLLKLTDNEDIAGDQRERIRWGCTCGRCIAGFMSPCVTHAISCQAKLQVDELLGGHLDEPWHISDGPGWVELHEPKFDYLPPEMRAELTKSESMRRDYVALFGHVANALRKKVPLIVAYIGDYADNDRLQNNEYLLKGGTIPPILQTCINLAMQLDEYLGNGRYQTCFKDQINKIPECRNDHEFVLVRRECEKLAEVMLDEQCEPSEDQIFVRQMLRL